MTRYELDTAIMLGNLQCIINQIDAFNTSSLANHEYEKFRGIQTNLSHLGKEVAKRIYKESLREI